MGPYSVLGKVSDQNYILSTRDRKKATQLCHINLLKPYFSRASPSGIGAGVKPVAVAVPFGVAGSHLPEAKVDELEVTDCMTQGRLKNSLSKLDLLLGHLPPSRFVSKFDLQRRSQGQGHQEMWHTCSAWLTWI